MPSRSARFANSNFANFLSSQWLPSVSSCQQRPSGSSRILMSSSQFFLYRLGLQRHHGTSEIPASASRKAGHLAECNIQATARLMPFGCSWSCPKRSRAKELPRLNVLVAVVKSNLKTFAIRQAFQGGRRIHLAPRRAVFHNMPHPSETEITCPLPSFYKIQCKRYIINFVERTPQPSGQECRQDRDSTRCRHSDDATANVAFTARIERNAEMRRIVQIPSEGRARNSHG